ncbi:MAG: mevalonate kinase [Halobacteriota archaeon]|nr:mevalonate kinase [Halobacteriota archaeon]
MSDISEGYGFGKVILFNEHFVVHGIPAIASAIEKKTIATTKDSETGDFVLADERPETPGYKKEKSSEQKDSLDRIFNAMNIGDKKSSVELELSGDLLAASGLGASAASCTAIARALSSHFGLGYTDEKINDVAYEGEKGYHGTPSGIDNTAATFGGLIWFKRGEVNVMEKLKLKEPVEIVIGNTGLVGNTSAAVAGVRKRKEEDPERYDKIFKEAEELVHDARKALESNNLDTVGELMNENHRLLQEIEVSCKELDMLVDIARDNGAIGAKMTGGGLGGNMVALTLGKNLQEDVAKAIEDKGFSVIKTRIGV